MTTTCIWLVNGDEVGGIVRSLLGFREAMHSVGTAPQVVAFSEGALTRVARSAGLSVSIWDGSRGRILLQHRLPSSLESLASWVLEQPHRAWGFVGRRQLSETTGIAAVHVRSPALLGVAGELSARLGVPLVWQIANAWGDSGRLPRLRRAVLADIVRSSGAIPLANSAYVAGTYRFLGHVPWAYVPIERQFFRAPYVEPPMVMRFVWAARVTRARNPATVVRAFERFVARGGNGLLDFVGVGDDTVSDQLRRAVAESPGRSAIRLRPFTETPLATLQGATVVLAGGEHPEAYSQVAAQALAIGRPVLALGGAGGPAELVARTGHGWVAQAYDVESIAQAMMCAYVESTDLTPRWKEVRSQAEEHFGGREFVRIYLSLIHT